MIWILATRGASTKLRATPFTETAIEGIHSVVYRPGIESIPFSGGNTGTGQRGTFGRGIHRISGVLFSYDGSVAETLLGIGNDIDLLIKYRASGQKRVRTLSHVLFIGDSSVTFPGINTGVSQLIGVPFRVQIAEGDTLPNHIQDTVEP